jgi:hypothetical protein
MRDYTYEEYEHDSDNQMTGRYSKTLPLYGGTANAIYIEDSTFTSGPTRALALVDGDYGGGRVVIRNNTGTGGTGGIFTFYSHETRGHSTGGTWIEVYNNTFNGGTWGTAGFFVSMRAGTGVVYNNKITNYNQILELIETRAGTNQDFVGLCDATAAHSWDGKFGDASAPGWPCVAQVGRGTEYTINLTGTGNTVMPSVPVLAWHNGPETGCLTDGQTCTNLTNVVHTGSYILGAINGSGTPHATSGAGNNDYEYCVAAAIPETCGTYTNTYTPYQYPHASQGADTTDPTLSNLTPTGTISYGTTAQLSVTTSENSTCRYHASSTTWADMTQMSSTGFITHTQTVNISVGANSFKAVCQDAADNESSAGTWSFTVSAAPTAPPPSALIRGTGGSLIRGSGGSLIAP